MATTLGITGSIKVMDGTTSVLSQALAISESYAEVTIQKVLLAASDTDIAINFGGVGSDASLVILVPTYATSGTPSEYLTCKVNSSATATPFGKLYVAGGHGSNGVDAITVTNPDTLKTVTLDVFICK